MNFTLWVDNGVVSLADNDVEAGELQDICARVYDKKDKVWHGMRKVMHIFFDSLLEIILDFPIFSIKKEKKFTIHIIFKTSSH